MSRWLYSLGCDPSHGGMLKTRIASVESDDYAFHVMRQRCGGSEMQSVFAWRLSGATSNQCSFFIHKLDQKYAFDIICMDMMGGGITVQDELRKTKQDNDRGEVMTVVPIVTRFDEYMQNLVPSGRAVDKLCMFGRKDPRIMGGQWNCVGIGFPVLSESTLPNVMHDKMKAAIEHGACWQEAVRPNGPYIQIPAATEDSKRFLDADVFRRHLNEIDVRTGGNVNRARVAMEIDLAYMQLRQVQRVIDTKQGDAPKTDMHGNFQFKSAEKKDAAYAACYARFGLFILQQEVDLIHRAPPKKKFPVWSTPRL